MIFIFVCEQHFGKDVHHLFTYNLFPFFRGVFSFFHEKAHHHIHISYREFLLRK